MVMTDPQRNVSIQTKINIYDRHGKTFSTLVILAGEIFHKNQIAQWQFTSHKHDTISMKIFIIILFIYSCMILVMSS